MTREELFYKLAKCEGAGDHNTAEDLLLEYLDDPDLLEIWRTLSDEWWYS